MSAPECHALLSASGAARWLNCPASARIEETLPESTSSYADEGRLAHSIAELKLRKALIEPMGQKSFSTALKDLQKHEKYDPEMLSCTDIYVDYVQSVVHGYASRPCVIAEKRVNYSHVAPEGFGTADCLVIGGDTLHVIDYKHGKGVPVSAENNPQMKLYALGAIRSFAMLFDIKRVVLAIVQPRLDSISEWEVSAKDLSDWGKSVKPIAAKAFAGEGEMKSGEWCRFCRAKGNCRVRAENHLSLEEDFALKKPPLLSNAEVGEALTRAQDLQAWIAALEEYALSTVLSGGEIEGWKAVAGRSNRVIDDVDTAIKILIQNGYDEAVFYTKKPVPLTEMERIVTKTKLTELLGIHIQKPMGKPTLAPQNDKRESYKTTNLKEDFGGK